MTNRVAEGRLAPILILGFALALVAAASAGNPGRETVRFNAADQAAAQAAALKRADFGIGAWHGGARKPDLSAQPACPNYHPKFSAFVVTGAAQTD